MSTDARSWDPLPEESPQARKAFALYLKLGLGRTLNDAWRVSQGQKGGETGVVDVSTSRQTAPSHWQAWYTKYCWRERALAYDRHQQLLADKEIRAVHKAKLLDYLARMESQSLIFQQFISGTQAVLLPQLTRLVNESESLSSRDMLYALGKLSSLTETWLALEASALRLPELISLLDEKEG